MKYTAHILRALAHFILFVGYATCLGAHFGLNLSGQISPPQGESTPSSLTEVSVWRNFSFESLRLVFMGQRVGLSCRSGYTKSKGIWSFVVPPNVCGRTNLGPIRKLFL